MTPSHRNMQHSIVGYSGQRAGFCHGRPYGPVMSVPTTADEIDAFREREYLVLREVFDTDDRIGCNRLPVRPHAPAVDPGRTHNRP